MRFIGIVGFDSGDVLYSTMTREMTFAEAADWFNYSHEYFSSAIRYSDPSLNEITISVYDASKRDDLMLTEPLHWGRYGR
jgi:hypothetical protein